MHTLHYVYFLGRHSITTLDSIHHPQYTEQNQVSRVENKVLENQTDQWQKGFDQTSREVNAKIRSPLRD